jgi:hypothetical protein
LILFPTQVGVSEMFVRQIVDNLWFWPGVRKFFRQDIRIPHYGLIFLLWAFGIYVILSRAATPIVMLTLAANLALFGTVCTGLGTFLLTGFCHRSIGLTPGSKRRSCWVWSTSGFSS